MWIIISTNAQGLIEGLLLLQEAHQKWHGKI